MRETQTNSQTNSRTNSQTKPRTSAPQQARQQTEPEKAEKQPSLSWPAMLGWMMLACLVAALIAYRLIQPFFARR